MKFLLISGLFVACLSLFISVNRNLPHDSSISIFVVNQRENTVIKTESGDEEPKQIDIYRNGQLFFKAFPARVDKDLSPEKGYITIIFDDGWLDTYETAFPLLKKYNFPASVAVIKSYVDKPGALSSRQIRHLINNGWDIVSHALSDTPLTNLSIEEQERQLKESKEFLWQKFWATEYFIFPFGAFDQNLIKLTKKYYKAARIYEEEVNKFGFDPYLINIESLDKNINLEDLKDIIDDVELKNLWLVLVGHHVSTHDLGEYTINSEKFEEIIKYINTKDIKVTPFGQALQELNPELSLIKEGKLKWEFKKSLIDKPYDISLVIKGKKSAPINVE